LVNLVYVDVTYGARTIKLKFKKMLFAGGPTRRTLSTWVGLWGRWRPPCSSPPSQSPPASSSGRSPTCQLSGTGGSSQFSSPFCCFSVSHFVMDRDLSQFKKCMKCYVTNVPFLNDNCYWGIPGIYLAISSSRD
jgi:hypothetical protein